MIRRSSRVTVVVLALGLATGCARPGPRVTEILWDTWGVPHVFARDEAELSYAFGWAQMHSHGDLLLRLYGESRGRAAEYWGEGHLDSDRWVRAMGVPGRAGEWYAAQSPEFRRLLDAFADGINAYADAHPDRIADEVKRVLPVTSADVLAHVQRAIHFTFIVGPEVASSARRRLAGSNAWAIGPSRSASGRAMLLANPHLPWDGLFTFYEAHLVTSGFDLYGATLVGFPGLGIAFNDRLGWTHTVNTLDGADLYELVLAGEGYRYDGRVRAFDERTELLKVRLDGGGFREETLTVRRSAHGPVIAQRGDRAIALRVVGLDAPGVLEQWWEMGRARSRAEFERTLARLQVPMFTVIYADRDGHILHVFNGRVPVRDGGGWDRWSGVVRGDTSATLWTEVHPYEDLPRVLDPATGWLQNANDPPWTTTFPPALDPSDFPAYVAPQGMAFRPQRSARMLASDSSVTFEDVIEYKHSTRMELADRLLGDLIPAARTHGAARAARAADVLEAWDRTADADSRGGVLFVAWIDEMRGSPIFAQSWSRDAPLATPDGLADPARAARALEAAAAKVERRHGALDVPWGEAHRLRHGDLDLPSNGGSDPFGVFRVAWHDVTDDGRFVVTGGDSYVAVVEFGDPVRARVLLSYGNASQPGSPHAGDQLPLFARKELREAWRTRAAIEAHLERREEVTRPR